MKCSTGKRMYDSQEMAERALIENRSRFYHNDDSGPVNVYQCRDCGMWHFTSKGPRNPLLDDQQVRKRISVDREANYWERKLR